MLPPAILTLLAAAMLPHLALAQNDDWAKVTHLGERTLLSVELTSSARRSLCRVIQADEDNLRCSVVEHNHEWLQDFPRMQIREIRLAQIKLHVSHRPALIGIAVGAGLFLLAGATDKDWGIRGGLTIAPMGALIGGGIGLVCCTELKDKVIEGPAIYQSGSIPQASPK